MINNVDIYDSSTEEAQPVELYEFNYGVQSYNYCTGGKDLTISGVAYKAISVVRKSYTHTDNLLKGGVKVELQRESEIGALAMIGLDDRLLRFKLYRADSQISDEKYLAFVGNVVSYKVEEASVTLDIEPPSVVANRKGFTPKFQRMCRHRLYSGGCKLDRSNYTFKRSIISHDANVIEVFWDSEVVENIDMFTFGQVFYNGTYRQILKVTKAQTPTNYFLTLSKPFKGLEVGAELEMTYGCDQTRKICHERFANTNNYGGFDFIPSKNPFGGVRVY